VRVCMWCTCDRVVVEAQDPPTLAIHIASSDDRARTFLVLALSRHRSLAWCDCAVSIKLRITFTAEYPAAVPEIELADAEGISGAQESQLRQQLEDMAQELVGSAMVFTLASHITEWINEYINNAEAAAAAAEAAAAEAAQAAKAAGPTEEERLAALVGLARTPTHTVSGESERARAIGGSSNDERTGGTTASERHAGDGGELQGVEGGIRCRDGRQQGGGRQEQEAHRYVEMWWSGRRSVT